MNKEIIGKAYLEYASSHGHFMLSETYIPLICLCVKKRAYKSVDPSIVKQLLDDEFGLKNITIGAVDAFLKRMVKLNYFKKENNAYTPLDKIADYKDDGFINSFLSEYETLLIDVREYIKKSIGIELTKETIDASICKFLNKYDLDIFYDDLSKIEKQSEYNKDEKQFAYLFSKYVLDAFHNNPQKSLFLKKLSKGHLLSSIVTFENLKDYVGRLDKVTIYLDAPLIYALLGFSNPVNKELIEEILSIVQKNGAKVSIFTHNYNEVLSTLADARDRLTTGDYDLKKSSRVLRYADREHKSPDFIQQKISQVDVLFEKWQIKVTDISDIPSIFEGIDEEKLAGIIRGLYKNAKHKYLLKYQETLIDTDVMSVSAVFRHRGNLIVHTLKNCVALLITTNRAICKASRDKSITNIHHLVPVALTDMDLSAILWTNNPEQNESLDKRLMIAECLENIQLDDNLLIRFKEDAKKKLDDGIISKDIYAILMTSHLTNQLLADKTCNDSDAYTDTTLQEIAEAFLEDRNQTIVDLEKENSNLQAQLKSNEDSNVQRIEDIHKRIEEIADTISGWLMWIFFILIVVGSLWKDIISAWSSILGYCLSGVAVVWMIYGVLIKTVCPTLPSIKCFVSKWIADIIYDILTTLKIIDNYEKPE